MSQLLLPIRSIPPEITMDILSFLPVTEYPTLLVLSKDFSTSISQCRQFLHTLLTVYVKQHKLSDVTCDPCDDDPLSVLKQQVNRVREIRLKQQQEEEERRKRMEEERVMRELMEKKRSELLRMMQQKQEQLEAVKLLKQKEEIKQEMEAQKLQREEKK